MNKSQCQSLFCNNELIDRIYDEWSKLKWMDFNVKLTFIMNNNQIIEETLTWNLKNKDITSFSFSNNVHYDEFSDLLYVYGKFISIFEISAIKFIISKCSNNNQDKYNNKENNLLLL